MKKTTSTIFFLFFLSLFSVSSQECVVPEQGMEISENTLFCSGNFNLGEGISIISDNVVLDCDVASLVGDGLGYGILVKANDGSIENCNLTNFEVGIYLEESSNNEILDNHISKNRFGIVLFGSEGNTIKDNILEENSRSDEIQISPSKLFEEPEEIIIETEVLGEDEIYKNVLRVKNIDLSDEELAFEFENTFSKFFNITQKNLELKRIYSFNKTSGETKIVLRIVPRIPLQNLSVYEQIPKCMSDLVENIIFESDNYEVIEEDPLIVWTFEALSSEKIVSYEIFKEIDNKCKDLLVSFGIATQFGEEITEEPDNSNLFLLFLLSLMVVFLVLAFMKIKRNQVQN